MAVTNSDDDACMPMTNKLYGIFAVVLGWIVATNSDGDACMPMLNKK